MILKMYMGLGYIANQIPEILYESLMFRIEEFSLH